MNLKETTGKRRWCLLPWRGAESVVRVMEHGADKYAPDNWRGNMNVDKYLDAIQRHAQRIREGEWIDPDSGEPHVSHIAAVGMMLAEDHDDDYRD